MVQYICKKKYVCRELHIKKIIRISSNPSAKSKDYDKKIFRLMFILNMLDGGHKVSTYDLAAEFKVDVRTVQRDLLLLNTAGFPIDMCEKGLHKFSSGFSLKKLLLSTEEASLLSLLSDIAQPLGKKFQESCAELLKKALIPQAETPYYIKVSPAAKQVGELPFIPQLEAAVAKRWKVRLQYEKEGGDEWKCHRVHPLKIVFYEGTWYLLSRDDDEKQIIKKFRLDKIRKLENLDENFQLSDNLKRMLDESVNIWFSEKRDKKVVLRVGREIADYFTHHNLRHLESCIRRFLFQDEAMFGKT